MAPLWAWSELGVCAVAFRAACAVEVVFVVYNLPAPPTVKLNPSFTLRLSIPRGAANLFEIASCHNGSEKSRLSCCDCRA